MRSVIIHLRDTVEDQVAAFLQQTYPFQEGPPWICDVAGDPCLYIDIYRDASQEFEPEEWKNLLAALGTEPAVSVIADVSGRHGGDKEVRAFVLAMLSQFHGLAQDDYTEHFWTAEEIFSGRSIEGRHFFDYRGWHLSQKERGP